MAVVLGIASRVNLARVGSIRVAMRVLLAGASVALATDVRPAAGQSPPGGQKPTAAVEQQIAAYRRLLADWAGLTRYGSENSELPPPRPGEGRVVFIGDDATEKWAFAKSFPGKPYINRGISGQNSAQMLVRFRQDVVGLKPSAVVIQAGSNDLARMLGPGTRGTFSDNIMSMTELAQAHGIRVVLASILPVCDCHSDQTSLRSPVRLNDWNAWLQEYARTSGSVYLDYHAGLAEGRSFKPQLTTDGVLPNEGGYAVMAPLADRAIAEALARPR
jgi:lysophospholipase L1-like esterase